MGKEKMKIGYQSRSLENYPRDIVDRVVQEYPVDSIPQVHLWLEDLRSDRLSRCALFLADGALQKLKEAVSLGRDDFRDLIMAAEYDRFQIQLRDFNLPFGSETVPNPLEGAWKKPNQPPEPTAPSGRGSS